MGMRFEAILTSSKADKLLGGILHRKATSIFLPTTEPPAPLAICAEVDQEDFHAVLVETQASLSKNQRLPNTNCHEINLTLVNELDDELIYVPVDEGLIFITNWRV